eukprot:GHVP01063701.1.p1 GENE.GHVP01063701.1~~GHVP01063701.1.p1  ORF type:complete len:225 (-),score=41.46 GHVP01063701.1:386-1009(-)
MTLILDISEILQVAASADHILVLGQKNNSNKVKTKRVWGMGGNLRGQLGLPITMERTSRFHALPFEVENLTSVAALPTYSLFNLDGDVYCVGVEVNQPQGVPRAEELMEELTDDAMDSLPTGESKMRKVYTKDESSIRLFPNGLVKRQYMDINYESKTYSTRCSLCRLTPQGAEGLTLIKKYPLGEDWSSRTPAELAEENLILDLFF